MFSERSKKTTELCPFEQWLLFRKGFNRQVNQLTDSRNISNEIEALEPREQREATKIAKEWLAKNEDDIRTTNSLYLTSSSAFTGALGWSVVKLLEVEIPTLYPSDDFYTYFFLWCVWFLVSIAGLAITFVWATTLAKLQSTRSNLTRIIRQAKSRTTAQAVLSQLTLTRNILNQSCIEHVLPHTFKSFFCLTLAFAAIKFSCTAINLHYPYGMLSRDPAHTKKLNCN